MSNTTRKLRVLDLFAGLQGWSSAFKQRGHDVTTVELEARFTPTICADILTLDAPDLWHPEGRWDVILASPPCTAFSVASIGKHWHSAGVPKSEHAELGMRLVQHTLELIHALKPYSWIMENPRGMLRKLPLVEPFERRTITFCKYGETRMKPTDLWGGFPPTLVLNEPCKKGDTCHEAAPRGSRTGTQGIKGADKRAIIPYQLSLAVCKTLEQELL